MAPNTRNLLIGSSLIVVVGLCTGLVAWYGDVLPGRAAATELAYLPSDVSGVGFADVRGIMASGFRQKLREVMPTGDDKNRMLEETGIDIERDIDTVVAGFSGSGPAGAVVILRGRFNEARLAELALSKGAQEQTYGGCTLYVQAGQAAAGGQAPEYQPAVALLDDGLIGIGEVQALHKAIDTAAGGAGVGTNPDIMRLVAGVQGAHDTWFVARATDITEQPQVPEQLRRQIAGVQWLSFGANIDQDVRAQIRAEATDDQRAQELRSVVAGALAAVKMFGEQDARLASALSSVQTAGTGRNIDVSFQVSPDLLNLLAAHASQPSRLGQ